MQCSWLPFTLSPGFCGCQKLQQIVGRDRVCVWRVWPNFLKDSFQSMVGSFVGAPTCRATGWCSNSPGGLNTPVVFAHEQHCTMEQWCFLMSSNSDASSCSCSVGWVQLCDDPLGCDDILASIWSRSLALRQICGDHKVMLWCGCFGLYESSAQYDCWGCHRYKQQPSSALESAAIYVPFCRRDSASDSSLQRIADVLHPWCAQSHRPDA